jgi:hypothetical protein
LTALERHRASITLSTFGIGRMPHAHAGLWALNEKIALRPQRATAATGRDRVGLVLREGRLRPALPLSDAFKRSWAMQCRRSPDPLSSPHPPRARTGRRRGDAPHSYTIAVPCKPLGLWPGSFFCSTRHAECTRCQRKGRYSVRKLISGMRRDVLVHKAQALIACP